MRLLIAAVAVVAVAVGFVLVRPDDESGSPTTPTTTAPTATEPGQTTTAETATTEPAPEVTRIVVRVRGGRSIDGIVRATASKGERVVVTVGSDVADHVHVHGYDLFADVGPSRPARIEFQATRTGRFEIELEDRGRQIAQLTVVP